MTPEIPQGGFGLRCLWAAGVFVSYDEPICVKSSPARHPAELQVRWFSGRDPSFLPKGLQAWAAEEPPPLHPLTPNPSPHPSPTPRPRPLKDSKLKHLTGPVSECDPQPGARNALCTHPHTHTVAFLGCIWDSAMGYHHLTLQRLSPAMHVLHRSCPTVVLGLAEIRWGCIHTCWVVQNWDERGLIRGAKGLSSRRKADKTFKRTVQRLWSNPVIPF